MKMMVGNSNRSKPGLTSSGLVITTFTARSTVRCQNEMVRIGNESLWVFRPGLTGHLEGSALDLAIGLGVVDLGQRMLDAVHMANTIKNMSTKAVCGPVD